MDWLRWNLICRLLEFYNIKILLFIPRLPWNLIATCQILWFCNYLNWTQAHHPDGQDNEDNTEDGGGRKRDKFAADRDDVEHDDSDAEPEDRQQQEIKEENLNNC